MWVKYLLILPAGETLAYKYFPNDYIGTFTIRKTKPGKLLLHCANASFWQKFPPPPPAPAKYTCYTV